MQPPFVSTTWLPGSRAISRLLVVRLSAMGDVLHALPAVAALRVALPATHFGWVIEQRWADLVQAAFVNVRGESRPIVDQVHIVNFSGWRRSITSRQTWHEAEGAIKEIRGAGYEVAVDFQGAVRSSLLARISGATSIYGFAEPRENVASMFYTKTVLTRKRHVIEQNLLLASEVAAPLHVPSFEFKCPASSNTFVAPGRQGYVVLNPGAGWGAKQWPAERYGEVAKRLRSELGLSSLINIGPGEESLMDVAESASDGAAAPISCSPVELIKVIRDARLFIGGDTGPMHLAAALKIPVVAIFGPTDPARTGPFGTHSLVLRSPRSRTTLSHQMSPDSAMLEISAEDVMEAALQLLGAPGE